MRIEDMLGHTITHKKYGEMLITDIDIDNESLNNSKFSATVNGEKKTFFVDTIRKFFVDVPNDLDISEFITKKSITKLGNIKESKPLTIYNFNRTGEELTLLDWKYSKNYVADFWFYTNDFPSPVVLDNKTLYIDAQSVCKHLGMSDYFVTSIYSVCNGVEQKKTLGGHKYRFAKLEDIDYAISTLTDDE